MPNSIHIHMAKAHQADLRRRTRADRQAGRAIARPPNRPVASAGANAMARIAARLDREAARRAIA